MSLIKSIFACLFFISVLSFLNSPARANTLNISHTPLYLNESAAPLMLLVISKNHKMFYEAYNDVSDLDNDGLVDTGYKPTTIDYYGYFDSYKCYAYSGGVFVPQSITVDKTCVGLWSGDFLNYVTTSKIDAVRKALYGGKRYSDNNSETVIERAYIPQDAHSWGKAYTSIAVNGYDIQDYTPYSLPSSGTQHFFANTTDMYSSGQEPLLRVALSQPYEIWEWVSIERPVADNRVLHGGSGPWITITDHTVRVGVCVTGLLEENCTAYPNGNFKPTGLLHQYGENDAMKFGLMTGSYSKNLSGGVIRKNVSSFTDEIDLNTGIYTSTNGIVNTINSLRIPGFGGYYMHNTNCGFIFNRMFNEGECRAWGNPVGEMLFEAVRYYSGKTSPTAAFDYSGSGDDTNLGLPKPSWIDPFDSANNPYCAKPNIMVISDVDPNFDSDAVPGSIFGTFSSDVTINSASLGQTIWNNEYGTGNTQLKFVGESNGIDDGAPSPKTVSSYHNIRGLATEPNKQGSYNAAAVAYYAQTTDLHRASGEQKIDTYVLTFPSQVTSFPIQVGTQTITFTPFAKSVGGWGGISPALGAFQPTNTIVDVYFENVTPTSGTIRVNFEDTGQGADHDMDAIAKYDYVVNADETLTITMTAPYAAGSVQQHMGYVIHGTTQDGVYLEVRDVDTCDSCDPDYYLDTPPGQLPLNLGGNPYDGVGLPTGSTATSRIFTPATGNSQSPILKSPLWLAAKYGYFVNEDENNLPDQTSEWDSDENGTPDNYFLVNNISSVLDKLAILFDQVVIKNSTASSAAVSSSTLNSDTRIYQAMFNSGDWSGQFVAYDLDEATGQVKTDGTGPLGSEFDAAEVIGQQHWDTQRNIMTWNETTQSGVAFRWDDIDATLQTILRTDPDTGTIDPTIPGLGQTRLDYIRGQRDQEVQKGGVLRDRSTVLGDIINSSPAYVAGPNFYYDESGWPKNSKEALTSNDYATFRNTYKNRTAMIYVGANDGMLHALQASNGSEKMAYVPNAISHKLPKLTSTNYTHQYYVDGAPTVADAFFPTQDKWRTVLVAGLNYGGQGIYALDVTDPNQLGNEANANAIVLWEFQDGDDRDLGYTYSQPSVVRLANGEWAAVFGNGYNNTEADGNASISGNAVLYVVNIETGDLIKKIDTGVGFDNDPLGLGRPNGLSSVAVADIDGNKIADYIYAGDLFGNLWRFDVDKTDSTQWTVGFNGDPLFIAKDDDGVWQPITTRPSLIRQQNTLNTIQIMFGTGKYLETSDKEVASATMQTFYAIFDANTTAISNRSLLLEQTIQEEMLVDGESSYTIRIVSNNTLTSAHRGWYLDLRKIGGENEGERQVTNSVYRDNKIIFTTLIPSEDPCQFGGTGWLMELNAKNGGRFEQSAFDLDGDGSFTSTDLVTYQGQATAISGIKSSVGILQSPNIIDTIDVQYKYATSSSGAIATYTENPLSGSWGRNSWHQLR